MARLLCNAYESSFFGTNVSIVWQLIRQKKSELLVAMAKDLGYQIDNIDADRFYAPNWLVESEKINLADRKLKLAAAEKILSGDGQAAAVQNDKTATVDGAVPQSEVIPARNSSTGKQVPQKSTRE